jgi:peptidoglycan/LPS O-acetylase OafA/YrhL
MHRGGGKFRFDIEGLRAVAVLSVVLYHAHVKAVSGGYIGVDVFFVISGYLITGLLWREVRERGRLSMGAFYGRRMRRLLPAAMLVLVVTMVAAVVWLPPLEIRSVWKDGVATALYAGNYRFAATQANYLASLKPPSPFQQYWSLGVEEQFYLVWPWLLAAAAIAWGPVRRRLLGGEARRPPVAIAMALLGLVAVASFVLSLWLTTANQPWAFFSLPTRAWELAAGGLVALAGPALRRLPKGAAAALGWAGLAVVVWAVLAFNASTPFPGLAALAPVGGAAAILAAGEVNPPFGPVLALGRSGMRLVGRTSYSWYLWHWPVLIILPVAIGGSLDVWDYLALAAGSWLLALATYHLVENPARRSRWLAARPQRSLASGLALSATGVFACVVAAQSLPSLAGHGVAPVASIRHDPASTGFGASNATAGRSSAVADPPPTQLATDQAQVAKALAESAGRNNLPANVQPPLAQENAASSAPFHDGCLLSFLDAAIRPCVYGDTTSSTSVVLFGDSHAAMWFPAFDQVALDRHWQLIVQSKANCPPVDVPATQQPYPACSPWRNAVINRIQAIHPALVVLAIAPNYDLPSGITQDDPQWLQGLSKVIASLRANGAQVMVMGPVPSPAGSVPDCLSAHLDNVTECNVPAGDTHDPQLVGYDVRGLAAERVAVERAGATFVDVEPWFCTATTCPVVVDNLLVFQDETHISVQYATYLAPLVADEIQRVIP